MVSSLVMAGHGRLKNGVASLAYARPSIFLVPWKRKLDHRVKPGDDAE
jgi:hypothetical protein